MIYDIIIIGGGVSGYHAANLGAKNKLKIALFEKAQIGGSCVNYGCMFTKTLVHSAYLYEIAQKEFKIFGLNYNDLILDSEQLWQRCQINIAKIQTAMQEKLDLAVSFISSEAKIIVSSHDCFKVEANQKMFCGKHLIMATGAKPKILKITGFATSMSRKQIIFPKDILSLSQIPDRLIIIGAGAAGLEFATFYSIMGCKVFMIEKNKNLAINCSDKIQDKLINELIKRGVEFLFDATIKEIIETTLVFVNGEKLRADKILICAGVEAMNNWDAKIELFDNFHMIGDCTNFEFTAAKAFDDAQQVINKIMSKPIINREKQLYPQVIFTIPEFATMGITEKIAKQKGLEVYTKIVPLSNNGRYLIEHPHDNGFIIGTYSTNNELLGIEIVGFGAGELLGMFSQYLTKNLNSIFAHPTLSEIMTDLIN